MFLHHMTLILSVLLFVFRSLFPVGIELGDTLGFASGSDEVKASLEITDTKFHPLLLEDSDFEILLIENQEEEKTESENFPLLYFVETATHGVSKKNYSNWEKTFFTSKPKIEGLHLYDLFHNWKSFPA